MSEKFYCWPHWMPLPQQDSYSYEPTDRRTRTDMEVGSVLRVNFDTDESVLNCTLILDAVQSRWFEAFEKKYLHQGATWFEMPLQAGGCIEWHTVRFASRPKASIFAPHYTQYDIKLDLKRREIDICDYLEEFLFCVSPNHLRFTASNAGAFWISLKKAKVPTWLTDMVADARG